MMDLNAEKCRDIILEHEPTAEARLSDQLLIDGRPSFAVLYIFSGYNRGSLASNIGES